MLESYQEGDVVEGRVTKVVTFGAFVEILPGVEGLVHISELAAHHVENPREIVAQGQTVNVKIIEVDAERRRLSLSLKRVEGAQPRPPVGEDGVQPRPRLDLSEDVFPEISDEEPRVEAEAGAEAAVSSEPPSIPEIASEEPAATGLTLPPEEVEAPVSADVGAEESAAAESESSEES